MKTVKVGDRVRVVMDTYGHEFSVGSVVTVTEAYGDTVNATDGVENWFLCAAEYEPIVPNRIVVGGEYTSENGNKWKCIHIDGDYAWMAPEGMKTAAYVFNTDGTNISQGGGDYNIKFEPVVEWVDRMVSISDEGSYHCGNNTDDPTYGGFAQPVRIRFPLIDGTPDWSQAKVTPA